MNRVRTPNSDWNKMCCSKCCNATIDYYDKEFNYYCLFTCPLIGKNKDVELVGFLDKHYCDNFKKLV